MIEGLLDLGIFLIVNHKSTIENPKGMMNLGMMKYK